MADTHTFLVTMYVYFLYTHYSCVYEGISVFWIIVIFIGIEILVSIEYFVDTKKEWM
jgi:hypothetical protein